MLAANIEELNVRCADERRLTGSEPDRDTGRNAYQSSKEGKR